MSSTCRTDHGFIALARVRRLLLRQWNQFQLYLLINIQLKMQGRVEPGVQVPAGPGREVEGSLLCCTYSVSGDPRSLPALTLTMPHCSLIARPGRDPNLDS